MPTCKYQKWPTKSTKNAKQKTLERGTLIEPKSDNHKSQKSANQKAPRMSLIQQSRVQCHSYFFSPLAGRQTDEQTKQQTNRQLDF